MKVRMSRHPITRMTQRAISGEMVQTIWEYGENLDAPGGATKVVLSRRIAKKLLTLSRFLLTRIHGSQIIFALCLLDRSLDNAEGEICTVGCKVIFLTASEIK